MDRRRQLVQRLASLRNAVPSRWNAKVEELRAFARTAARVSLSDFVRASGLLHLVYQGWRAVLSKKTTGLALGLFGQ